MFFIGWIYVFCLLNTVIGIEYANDDYPAVPNAFIMILQVYRNSIGDIATPSYDMWQGENMKENPFTCNFMILVIWVSWFVNQYLNLIILLNFLIAIISQSYEEIMTEQSVFRYQHRA